MSETTTEDTAPETPNATPADLARQLAQAKEADQNNTDVTEPTELEQAEARNAELQRLLDYERLENARLRIAMDYGIDPADRDVFLTGQDEETLTRQALRLQQLFPKKNTTPRPHIEPRTPQPDTYFEVPNW